MLIKVLSYFLLLVVGVHLIQVKLHDDNASWGGKGSKHNFCGGNNNKLLSVLNLLCNTTQNTSVTTRDACYGCFFRAGILPAGSTQLSSLSQCASIYLVNTTYALCATNLASVASGIRPTTAPTIGNCYTGYCEFIRCVRRINSNSLIDTCMTLSLVGRNISVQADRVAVYTNTTSCILARARCSQFNPITGELQGINYANNYPGAAVAGLGYFSNALQVTTGGDIRIVSFPLNINVQNYFCTSQTGLDQSVSGDYVC